jgi:imidazolonepropionase-like amidohydrolase
MLSLLMLLPLTVLPADDPPTAPLVITNVTVIDTRGGPSLPDRTVVIRGGTIGMVLPAVNYSPVSPDAILVDGKGKFLIPGLWDMHVHLTSERTLALNLANGVTGLRVMWGNPAMTGFPVPHSKWRKEIEEGKRKGPRLVVASNILDGPKPIWPGSVAINDEAQARKAVRDAKAAGADFLKVYSLLSPEAFRAIADEAKLQGLPFAGHVPSLVSAREASDLGMRSMEHLYGLSAACSPHEAEALRERKEALDAAKGNFFAAGPKLSAIDTKLRESYRDDLADSLFAKLKSNGTWQCPTLTVLRAFGSLEDPEFTADPRLRYVDPFTRMFWDPKRDFRLKSMKPEDFAAQRRSFERGLVLVGKMHKAGVPILAGTDEANPYIFPGFSLHDELALFVKAGLSPAEALRTATLNPAKFLGREATLGTVEPGKVADLVLLDADPLADIASTTKIRAVISRGRLLDRPALDGMLKAAEYPASATQKPAGGYCPAH